MITVSNIFELAGTEPEALVTGSRTYWTQKLNKGGLQPELPPLVAQLDYLFCLCRTNLLILSSHAQMHSGQTITTLLECAILRSRASPAR